MLFVPSTSARRLLIALLLLWLALTACRPVAPPIAGWPDQPSPVAQATPSQLAPLIDAAIQRGYQGWALRACQSCHGPFGEGASGPALRNTSLTGQEFRLWVRNGGQGMRGYSGEEIDDGQIADLHAWLQSLPAEAPQPIPNPFGLTLPPAMRVSLFAEKLIEPAALAVGPEGTLAVAAGGVVWQLFDQDGDGRADASEMLAAELPQPSALFWLAGGEGPLLLAGGQSSLWATAAGQSPRLLLDSLPGVEHFQINGLALGMDGLLYVTVGPPWDGPRLGEALQPGAVWRLELADLLAGRSQPELFASGLRSAWGIAFSPSGAIYVIDSGLGWPFQPDVPDELNLLLGGGNYGWPRIWGQPAEDSGTLPPMVQFPPGSGASSLLYASGRMFPEYANDQIVALSGQAGVDLPGGPRLVRVEIVSDVTGYHSYVHEFASGFRRPLALAEGGEGAFFVADAGAGVVYRLYR